MRRFGDARVGDDTRCRLATEQPAFIVLPRFFSNETAISQMGAVLEEMYQKWVAFVTSETIRREMLLVAAAERKSARLAKCKLNHDGHGDMRCGSFPLSLGSETFSVLSPVAKDLLADPFLKTLVESYFHAIDSSFMPRRDHVLGSFVSGPGENSGGGWHQDEYRGLREGDTLGDVRDQVKCMLYLTDVLGDNAPFTMLVDYDRSALKAAGDRREGSRAPLQHVNH